DTVALAIIVRNHVCDNPEDSSVMPDCGFFFQAEDGIRDGHVTGVQTCALPIYEAEHQIDRRGEERGAEGQAVGAERPRTQDHVRSEERRVGKECRSRWSPD